MADDCTLENLRKVLEETEPEVLLLTPNLREMISSSKSRNLHPDQVKLFRKYLDERQTVPRSQEVYPKIHIGEAGAAKDINYLKNHGVSHIMNTAMGTSPGEVDTSEDMYKPHGIKFLGINLIDSSESNLNDYLDTAFEFMDEAIDSGNSVMVHCFLGMSRSPAVIIAYLMAKKGMTAIEALRYVRKQREIVPNDGFLLQLSQLDNELRKKRSTNSENVN